MRTRDFYELMPAARTLGCRRHTPRLPLHPIHRGFAPATREYSSSAQTVNTDYGCPAFTD